MKQKLNELKERWNSPTNKFWKPVITFAKWLVGTAGAVIALNALTPGISLPDILIRVCSYILVGGTIMGIQAKLTKP